MCGIAGIHSLRGEDFGRDPALRAMNQTLVHRGPDDEGLLSDGATGLAMRRLKIIDLEGGHQPLSNEDGSVWTVFNGEIYNYRELRRDLTAKGHRFQTQSDTEVLVHLYEEKGEGMLTDLHGMFAFAIWDKRQAKLLLARDPIGIKPLYYYAKDGLFLFASEMKAILQYPDVDQVLDWQALSDYLGFLYIPAPKTIYKHLRKLEPGHLLILQQGHMQIRRYWELKLGDCSDGLGEENLKSRLFELTQNAVQSHLASDVPVGAFLSGGVDSSIVTALMARAIGPSFHTFSVGFDEPLYDETFYAKTVARHLGTTHHELRLDSNILEDLPRIVRGFDEPFGDSSAMPAYHLARFARQWVTVALAGDGGDELFAGYEWLRCQRSVEAIRRVMPFGKKILSRLTARSDTAARAGNLAGLSRLLWDASNSPMAAFYRRSTCLPENAKEKLLGSQAKRELRGYSSWDFFCATAERSGADFYGQMLFWDSTVYLPDDDLCKVDRTSMAHSLEVRVPVLDLPLVQASACLPFRYKLRGWTTKMLWKKAFAHLLPPVILRQRKQGFSVPLDKWLRPYLGQARNFVLAKDSFCSNALDPGQVARIFDLQATGQYRMAHWVYLLLVLELWHRGRTQHLSGETLRELVQVGG